MSVVFPAPISPLNKTSVEFFSSSAICSAITFSSERFLQTNAFSSAITLFCHECNVWHNHLFERNTSMLKCITVMIHVMIVIIGISKKFILFCKNVCGTHIYTRSEEHTSELQSR